MTYSRWVALFLGAMLAHWFWTADFALAGLAPQILLVLTVAIAARHGPIPAMCLGFAWGLFLDAMSAHLFGANALALAWVGYGTGSVRRQIDVTGLVPQCVVVFGMSWAYFLLTGLLGLVFMKTFLWVGWAAFLIDPLYNCLVTAGVFVFLGQWMEGRHL